MQENQNSFHLAAAQNGKEEGESELEMKIGTKLRRVLNDRPEDLD